ncbi:hypothetical protein B0H17DRAFT_1209181 [Mycena rosella]|uniref:Uncharacterized protein n=1 Tax=Mycena rosella TaxID=1033263 RepID=A0AAD7G607_MYCRO|nr:hypothetical protein B0H17DRAFT_1209181 [Mycena rosella]
MASLVFPPEAYLPIWSKSLAYYNKLRQSPDYLASPAVVQCNQWSAYNGGKILRQIVPGPPVAGANAPQYTFLTVVALVSDKLVIKRPDTNPVWATAWDALMPNLKVFETQVCEASEYLWTQVDKAAAIRASKKVFMKKGGSDAPDDVDLKNWQTIPKPCVQAFTDALESHDLRGLLVFGKDNNVIAPAKIQSILPGCLIQLSARLVYYEIKNGSGTKHSINAEIAQAWIIEDAPPPPVRLFTKDKPHCLTASNNLYNSDPASGSTQTASSTVFAPNITPQVFEDAAAAQHQEHGSGGGQSTVLEVARTAPHPATFGFGSGGQATAQTDCQEQTGQYQGRVPAVISAPPTLAVDRSTFSFGSIDTAVACDQQDCTDAAADANTAKPPTVGVGSFSPGLSVRSHGTVEANGYIYRPSVSVAKISEPPNELRSGPHANTCRTLYAVAH